MVYIGIVIIALVISSALFVFGFWIGRCGRRLPAIDDRLPWTMSREAEQSGKRDRRR